MGSELQLTGLASGFDWSPVVDQLIELERIPQNRLVAEKQANQEKISDLDLLKSQLDALNGAGKALQSKSLFEARKVGSSDFGTGFSASADAGSMTGDFSVQVDSLATRTEMSSANRSGKRLGGGINTGTTLAKLPIHTEITAGTFTISGRTFNITSLDVTLQDILDEINAQSTSIPGVNPESDLSAVTASYDANSDKLVLDSGEKSPGVVNKPPILGSSTDSSNFLQAMGLLSRTTELVDADVEANSGVSIFASGDGNLSWIHSSDPTANLALGDSRSYSSFGGKLYERIQMENQFNASDAYLAGERVYQSGFVYESLSSLPQNSWDGTQVSVGDQVKHGSGFYELLVDLGSVKTDLFSSVDSGDHSVAQATNAGSTNSTSAYKAGDIVQGADGSFFRSIMDRHIPTSIDWNNYTLASGYSSSIDSQGWTGNLPQTAHLQGRAYQIAAGASAVSHGGTTDSTIYSSANGWGSSLKMVFGKSGVAGAEGSYFVPKTKEWDKIDNFSNSTSYQSGDIVLSGGQFMQANSTVAAGVFNPADWSDVTNSINDLSNLGTGGLADDFWQKADLSFSNSIYWSEIAHANTRNDYDSNYWQEIAPEMKRFDASGSGLALDSIDFSIWAQVASVGSFSGDSVQGNRDGLENPLPSDTNFTYDTWTGSALAGDYINHNGNVYEARVNTSNEPGILGSENDWNIIADSSTISAASVTEQANKKRFTDTEFWTQFVVPDPDQASGHWKIVQEQVLSSSQALGNIDMSVSLASANFSSSFSGLASGLGNFFIGEGEGAVRIDYDVNNDTLSELIDRVNRSDANVHMFYDPVSDRFVMQSKKSGSLGLVMHESPNWDSIASANIGSGNILNLMGFAAPSSITTAFDSSALGSYVKGDYVEVVSGSETTYWQAMQDAPTDSPTSASSQWSQVILGVGRALESELGNNSVVRVNGGNQIYSTETAFTQSEHGYEGITFDIARVSIGRSVGFSVGKDTGAAKSAIDKFVEEFNDAQDYIKSLVSVTNDGENVTAGRFSSNLEISRLGSQLRKVAFGDSTPHSASGTTSDGANLIINSNDSSNTEILAVSTQLNLGSTDNGYVIKVLDDNSTGLSAYYEWDGSAWQTTNPTYSSFRLSNIGLDFGIGSDNIQVKNSALLLQALEEQPEKVQALFSESTVENAFDSNTQRNRTYGGISYSIDTFISSFLTGDSNTGYKGAYTTHVESIKSQNNRLDDRIEDLDSYLEQREETLRAGFMRMEEMQSKINTQMQTLQSSFNNNKK